MRLARCSYTFNMRTEIIDLLELPKDILLGIPLLTLKGDMEITIENHKGILSYTSVELEILAKNFRILIIGEEMMISQYSKDSITIKGKISVVTFKA